VVEGAIDPKLEARDNSSVLLCTDKTTADRADTRSYTADESPSLNTRRPSPPVQTHRKSQWQSLVFLSSSSLWPLRPRFANRLLPTLAAKDYNQSATLPRIPPARTSSSSETQNLACSLLPCPFHPSTLYLHVWAFPIAAKRCKEAHQASCDIGSLP